MRNQAGAQYVDEAEVPDVGSDEAVTSATLAGLEGMGMGLLARWCHDPGPVESLARLRRSATPTSQEVAPERWRTWRSQLDTDDAVSRTARALAAAGARALVPGDDGYPDRLAEDARAPAVLIRRGAGEGPESDQATVAIIGTRRASQVGREIACELATELAGRGVVVLSGMARGIDAAAHRGALEVDPALTVGVIGCGPDQVYPPEHRTLWTQVSTGGGLLGEWPPGVPPNAWRFPARNRLLAALADVVVVVESARSGGSMHTVREAIDRSRPVLAVPGSVRSKVAEGTNLLISEGCDPCLDAVDVLCALSRERTHSRPGVPTRPHRPSTPARAAAQGELFETGATNSGGESDGGSGAEPGLDPLEASVLEVAGWRSVSLERIIGELERLRAGATVAEVAAAVGSLCQRGALVEQAGWYERTGRVEPLGEGRR
ncbi:MAG: DNA-processing protein DprA [Microthrixaceae bacterium]